MTREQLLALGFTEEQVNSIMALHGQATQNLRGQITTLTNDLNVARNNQVTNQSSSNTTQQQGNPGDDNELDTLRQQIANLQKENARKDIEAYAVAKGLTGDQVKNILNAFGENVDVAKQAIDSIGQIISDNRTAAAREKEQELANGATNPGGGNAGSSNSDEKSNAEKIAERMFSGKKQSNDILSHYVNGGN